MGIKTEVVQGLPGIPVGLVFGVKRGGDIDEDCVRIAWYLN